MKRSAAALCTLIAGCVSVPPLNPPALLQPTQIATSVSLPPTAAAEFPRDEWWREANDPQLNALITLALRDNPSLPIVLARLHQAQAQIELARANGGIRLNFGAELPVQRFTENSIIPPPLAGEIKASALAGVDFSYEIDWLDRTGKQIQAAQLQAAAAGVDLALARQGVALAVTRGYLALDLSSKLHQTDGAAVKLQMRTMALIERRVRAGLDSDFDRTVIAGRLAEAKLKQTARAGQIQLTQQALNALTGSDPDASTGIRAPKLAPFGGTQLPLNLPLDLLGRRADLVALRLRLQSLEQSLAAQRDGFYPSFNLNASAGLSAIGLDRFLQAGSLTAAVTPALRLPIFNAGRLRAAYLLQGLNVDVLVGQYNQTLRNAFNDAANALTLIAANAAQQQQMNALMAAQARLVMLSERRFAAGVGNALPMLEARIALNVLDQQQLALSHQSQEARIRLIEALGGGFSANPSEKAAQHE